MEELSSEDLLVRDFVVAGLIIELLAQLSQLTGDTPKKIAKNFQRRIRRGHSGLDKKYVEEELIRRLANDLSRYSVDHPATIIERIEVELRGVMRREWRSVCLVESTWRFPTSNITWGR